MVRALERNEIIAISQIDSKTHTDIKCSMFIYPGYEIIDGFTFDLMSGDFIRKLTKEEVEEYHGIRRPYDKQNKSNMGSTSY